MEEQQEIQIAPEKIEALRELSKFYTYHSLIMQSMYQNDLVAEARVYFMDEVVPSEFVKFTVNGEPVSNEGFCSFASNAIMVRQKNSDTWIIMPFTFKERAIFKLHLDKIRSTSGVKFEQQINAFQPTTHTLFQTDKLTFLQLIRNVFTLPLNTIRRMIECVKSRHL